MTWKKALGIKNALKRQCLKKIYLPTWIWFLGTKVSSLKHYYVPT